MYWSEVKHLLRYLVYNCDDPKSYISLALTCKYAAELTRYYSPMKMRVFCKNIKTHEICELSVLPNGRILKEKYFATFLPHLICYNVRDNYRVSYDMHESDISSVLEGRISSYFFNDIHYTVEKTRLIFKKYPLYLQMRKCKKRGNFHKGYLNNSKYSISTSYVSSYCGLGLRVYRNYLQYLIHKRRRKVVRAVIEYSQKLNLKK